MRCVDGQQVKRLLHRRIREREQPALESPIAPAVLDFRDEVVPSGLENDGDDRLIAFRGNARMPDFRAIEPDAATVVGTEREQACLRGGRLDLAVHIGENIRVVAHGKAEVHPVFRRGIGVPGQRGALVVDGRAVLHLRRGLPADGLKLILVEAREVGEVGADASPLSAILTGDSHRAYVELPDEALRTLHLWLDAHVPFFGTYEEEWLQAQKRGRAVPIPRLQ